jgi:transcriptional regulator with XRE-family HTH domain
VPSTTDPPLYDCATLKSWREAAGLSRERVSADMRDRGTPVSFSWLVHLEQGTAPDNPSLGLLGALAAYYGRDMAELFAAIPASRLEARGAVS